MSFRVIVKDCNLNSRQEQHLLNKDAKKYDGILELCHMGTFPYDEIFCKDLFPSEFLENNVFEYNSFVFIDELSLSVLDEFPDWLYGTCKNGVLNHFRVNSFIDYYLNNIFGTNFEHFKKNLSVESACMPRHFFSHESLGFDKITNHIKFSYVDLQINKNIHIHKNKSFCVNMNIKERVGFLLGIFYYLSLSENNKKRFIKLYDFPDLKVYGFLSSTWEEVSPNAVFANNNEYFLNIEPNRKYLIQSLNYLNDKMGTDVAIESG